MNSFAGALNSPFPRHEREDASGCHMTADLLGRSGDRPALADGFIVYFFKEEVN